MHNDHHNFMQLVSPSVLVPLSFTDFMATKLLLAGEVSRENVFTSIPSVKVAQTTLCVLCRPCVKVDSF